MSTSEGLVLGTTATRTDAGRRVAGLRAATARALIAAVPLAAVVWYPVTALPGLGNLTVLDLILLCLWPLALLDLSRRPGSAAAAPDALRLAALALMPGLFAGLGVAVFGALGSAVVPDASAGAVGEVLHHVKRFGAAAILPLAVARYGSPRLRRACTLSLLLASAAMTAFALHPDLRSILPVQAIAATDFGAQGRQSGLVANPNDYAYVSLLALAMLAALAAGREVRRPVRYALVLVGAGGAFAGLVLSGSRSALVGFAAGLAYLLVRGHLPAARKALVVVAVAGLLLVGFQGSAVFRERLTLALAEGSAESNLAARLDAQQVLLAAWLGNPAGVGYQNFAAVSRRYSGGQPFVAVDGSDSVYVDTLAASGLLGLAALLALFWAGWRYVGRHAGSSSIQTDLLRAGCLGTFVLGLGTVAPLSVVVAPYLFLLIACSTLLAADTATEGSG